MFFCVIGIVHLSAIIVVTDGAGGEGIVVGVDEERRYSVAARWVWVGTLVWRPPPVPSRPSPQSFRSWWSEGPADNSWSQHRPGSN